MKLSLYNPAIDKVYDLPDIDRIVIGRNSEESDFVIPYKDLSKYDILSVSRAHCVIYREGEDFFVLDIKSKNGTYLDNEDVRSQTGRILENGQVLSLGPVKLEVIISNDNEDARAARKRRRKASDRTTKPWIPENGQKN